MAQTKLSCFWKRPDSAGDYQAAVSLHSHTEHSKESLHFIHQFAQRCALWQWTLECLRRRAAIPVDFSRAYWTPPLTAMVAFEVERTQIEDVLGLVGLISLTDHDTIEAPTLLRAAPETMETPISLEWTAPFGGAVFHLGIHNLPVSGAQMIMADLGAYTRDPSDSQLSELMDMLDQFPEVLIVFNHPLWDLHGLGQQQYVQVLHQFLEFNVRFLHAFELNATRSWKENNGVIHLADRWQRLLISGGDRHGFEPSGALNLTCAECFPEFIHEIRRQQRSHVLFMPQYAEPLSIRVMQTVLDVIRDYPHFPAGSRRWDNRVFHPDWSTNTARPASELWKVPPPYIEHILSAIRLMESAALRSTLRYFLGSEMDLHVPAEILSANLHVPAEIPSEAIL